MERTLPTHGFFTLRRTGGIIALALWVASLTQPAMWKCNNDRTAIMGYDVAWAGWIDIVELQLGWFANPFMLWVMGRLMLSNRAGLWPAIIGLGLAICAFWWNTIGSEMGNQPLCGRGPGFYLWIACAVLLAAIALAERFLIAPREDLSTGSRTAG
jgi:hypothetical protein